MNIIKSVLFASLLSASFLTFAAPAEEIKQVNLQIKELQTKKRLLQQEQNKMLAEKLKARAARLETLKDQKSKV